MNLAGGSSEVTPLALNRSINSPGQRPGTFPHYAVAVRGRSTILREHGRGRQRGALAAPREDLSEIAARQCRAYECPGAISITCYKHNDKLKDLYDLLPLIRVCEMYES